MRVRVVIRQARRVGERRNHLEDVVQLATTSPPREVERGVKPAPVLLWWLEFGVPPRYVVERTYEVDVRGGAGVPAGRSHRESALISHLSPHCSSLPSLSVKNLRALDYTHRLQNLEYSIVVALMGVPPMW